MGFLDRLTAGKKKRTGTAPASTPEGFVEGTIRVEAVGESHYQDALESVCGGKSKEGHEERPTVAALIHNPENPYDQNAVEVRIEGSLVGHLPRQAAATLAPKITNRRPPLVCRAWITGGWDRGGGDTGMFGVVVMLPHPDVL